MARTFHRPKHLHPVAELNVTNLIDLGFTLLIIFMIATPLIQQGQRIPLDLPVESAKAQSKEKEQAQVVGIDRNGNYYWGDRRTNLPQIRVNLAALAEMPKPPVIRIEADFTLQYQQVVTVLDEVKKAGLSRISLETQTSK
jgi:biopolymer transport protein TolR